MRIGVHVRVGAGYAAAIEYAKRVKCTAIQIFNKSNNQWAARPLGDAEVQRFRAARTRARIDPVVAHDSYLINLCSPDDALYARSIGAVVEELERCRRLGVEWLVVHPGGHMGQGEDFGEDKHKAPTSAAPHSLSLRNGGVWLFQLRHG